jgi:hypothetical protein
MVAMIVWRWLIKSASVASVASAVVVFHNLLMMNSNISTMSNPIENVFIYISDSVRWDIGKRLLNIEGAIPIKTAAHSTFTFSSIPSLLRGVIPQHHGVYSPRHRSQFTPDMSIFELPGFESSLNLNSGQSMLEQSVFPEAESSSLAEVESPFVAVEHDIGGHAPYGTNYESVKEFFNSEATTRDALVDYYERAIGSSTERLQSMLDTLEQRDLLDSTLVILTSDHGELLYDYGGLTAHVRPVTPELVYVPTVLHHSSIDQSSLPDFIHHSDLVPTILSQLGFEPSDKINGSDILSQKYTERPALNSTRFFPQSLCQFGDPCIYKQESVWGPNGGHVFNRSGVLSRILSFAADGLLTRKFIGGRWNGYHPEPLRKNLNLYLDSYQQFNAPAFSREDASQMLSIESMAISETYELDDSDKEQLRDLGYL